MQQFLHFIILTFIYSSTCLGCRHAHHQELKSEVTASGLPLERGGSSAVGRGRTGYITCPTTTNSTAITTI
jgi:hypothetical protein